jgi:hypothetical protein
MLLVGEELVQRMQAGMALLVAPTGAEVSEPATLKRISSAGSSGTRPPAGHEGSAAGKQRQVSRRG